MIRSTRLTSSVLTLALLGAAAGAQSRPIGWTYTMNITTDSGGPTHRSSMATRHSTIAGKVRMEFVQVSNVALGGDAEGSYQVINATDSTMLMVMPKQHAATIMSIGTTLMNASGPMKFESHVAESHVDDLGAGERILGHPTHHVRVSSEGTIDITISGQSCTAKLNRIGEMWIAPDVDLREATESMLSTYNAALGGSLGVDIPTATRSSLPPGTSLRTISKTTRPNAQGRMTTVTTTMEYVELAHGPLDPALFTAPADFKVMDMRKMMANMPAGLLDSVTRATRATTDSSAKHLCNVLGGEP